MHVNPIAVIHTPYKEKFAIPRQPGLVKAARGRIVFASGFDDPNALRGIEQFSHLWLLFQFHQTQDRGWSPLVRPPRLGGNEKTGVFATRSTFRPNNIGLSVVKNEAVEHKNGQLSLLVSGMDLLDQTPIIDIKPYIPYADSVHSAQGGFAESAPTLMPVEFAPDVQSTLKQQSRRYPHLEELITQVLGQDPRPAYQREQDSSRVYGVHLHDLNIRWQVVSGTNSVFEIVPAE